MPHGVGAYRRLQHAEEGVHKCAELSGDANVSGHIHRPLIQDIDGEGIHPH
jgi:hypothetical protein